MPMLALSWELSTVYLQKLVLKYNDSVGHSMKEGDDFWLKTVSKLEATKTLSWL